MRRDLLQPSLRTACPGDPDTADQLGLADIHRSNPRDELFLIDRFSRASLLISHLHAFATSEPRDRPGGLQGKKQNLVLVLTTDGGNNEGPTRDPRARLVDALNGA